MPTNWEKFKTTVKGGLSKAAAKTRKYAKIGKINYGKININKSIDNTFLELGAEVYNQISDGTNGDVAQSKKVKNLIAKINHFKQFIEDKDLEIKTIKQGSVAQNKTDADIDNSPDVKAEITV